MGFEIVWNKPGVPMIWLQCDNASTYHVGELVKSGANAICVGNGTVGPLAVASGYGDNTTRQYIFGVVTGTNLKTPAYNSTYKTDYVTGHNPHGNTTEYVLNEGINAPKGDTAAYVQVAPIFPDTVLKGQIFNAAFGTAITEGNVTSNNTSGNSIACSAGCADFTPVASAHTVYCRKGLNRGVYRVGNGTSATTLTTLNPFPYDVIIGDTYVTVPYRIGHSRAQFTGAALYWDANNGTGTNCFFINVYALNLEESGREYMYFTFLPNHFGAVPQVT